MNKSILVSIYKKHNDNIESGLKKLELRKFIPKDFDKIIKEFGGIWVYTYETLSNGGRGKITNRWWFNEYTRMIPSTYDSWGYNYTSVGGEMRTTELHKQLCLDYYEVGNYGNNKDLYAWHIKKLEIFDEPMELNDFYTKHNHEHLGSYYKMVERPPQSWQYVYVRESKKNE